MDASMEVHLAAHWAGSLVALMALIVAACSAGNLVALMDAILVAGKDRSMAVHSVAREKNKR